MNNLLFHINCQWTVCHCQVILTGLMGVSVGVRGWSWFKYSWTDTPLQISTMRANFKAVFLSLSVMSLSNFNQHLHSQFSWYKRIWGIISKLRHSTFMICEKQKFDFSMFGIQPTRLVTYIDAQGSLSKLDNRLLLKGIVHYRVYAEILESNSRLFQDFSRPSEYTFKTSSLLRAILKLLREELFSTSRPTFI